MEFLSVVGRALILKDKKKNDLLLNSILKDWLDDGDDASDITLIKVNPENAFYWKNC